MKTEYNFLSIDGASRVARVRELFLKNGNEKRLENLRWQYSGSPAGEALSTFAVDSTQSDAAVYSVAPVVFLTANSEKVVGAQSLDTLTDVQHRGKGLFLTAAKKLYEQGSADGISFVYGFPNQFSGPGFFRKLNWSDLGYPPFRILAWNLLYPLKRITGLNFKLLNCWRYMVEKSRLSRELNGKRFKLSTAIDFSGEPYKRLWNLFASTLPLCIERDAAYMNWRYKQKPAADYKFLAVEEGGELQGVCVYALREKHGGAVGYIMDLIYNPGRLDVGNILLSKTSLELRASGADVVLAWADKRHRENRPYDRVGYSRLPRRLQPIKLSYGALLLDDKCSVDDLRSMYISYADSDTV